MEEKIAAILEEIRPGATSETGGNLVNDGMLDSLGIVTLVANLEDAFDVEIDPDDIVPENFASIETIAEMVKRSA